MPDTFQRRDLVITIADMKLSFKELRNLKSLTAAGYLAALAVVCNAFISFKISPTLQIDTLIIPIALAGMLFGPIVGGLVGAASDIIGLFSTENPFFGFTFNYFLMGIIFGFFLYKQEKIMLRLLIAQLLVSVLITFALTGLWFSIMGIGGPPHIMWTNRAIKTAVVSPLEFVALFAVIRTIVPIYNKHIK
ncbi:MAG: folate family ECF transporter S component [Oscillospiraceae bacterium]|nr:folate family ECF transporter S component [Oscillospiraceae bacterium]